MVKKYITLSIVAALVACMSGSASADMMPGPDFTDTKVYTPGNGQPLQNGFTYEHDIRPYYDIPTTYLVDAGTARLELTFWDSAQNETVVSSAWDGTGWTPFLTIVDLANGFETISLLQMKLCAKRS